MSNIADAFESMEYGSAPESPDRVMEWLRAHEARFRHFIDGEWIPGSGDERIESVNPATGEVLASVPQGTAEDVDRAVEAAAEAFGAWSGLSGHDRARYLYVDEHGIAHWCSQKLNHFEKALLDYTRNDLKEQFFTEKPCNTHCTIGCARTCSAYDEWRR